MIQPREVTSRGRKIVHRRRRRIEQSCQSVSIFGKPCQVRGVSELSEGSGEGVKDEIMIATGFRRKEKVC